MTTNHIMNQTDTNNTAEAKESGYSNLRDYAWKYFEFHAEQRMKTFHFFLLMAGGLIAGFVSKVGDQKEVAGALGFLLAFLSFVFGKLEMRNRELVKNGEAALKHLDNLERLNDAEGQPNPLKLFARDDLTTRQFPNEKNIIKASFAYSTVLALVFWVLALLGLSAGIFCIWKSASP